MSNILYYSISLAIIELRQSGHLSNNALQILFKIPKIIFKQSIKKWIQAFICYNRCV